MIVASEVMNGQSDNGDEQASSESHDVSPKETSKNDGPNKRRTLQRKHLSV